MNKIKNSLKSIGIAAAFICAGAARAQAAPTLKMGDPAPELKIAKWVQGQPVQKFEPGKVYVVEFWATWCVPCKVSIPHLTEMAKKDTGKATFTGVDITEGKDQGTEACYSKVETFVKEMGAKMAYNVAVDGSDNFMSEHWMKAAAQPGIPTAFIVDQTGKIAWIGHPMAMDDALDQVIAGTFDTKAYADKLEKEQAAQRATMAIIKPVFDAMGAKNYKGALEEIKKIEAEHPELAKRVKSAKFHATLHVDEHAACDMYRKMMNDPSEVLVDVANMGDSMIRTEGLSKDTYLLGVSGIEAYVSKGVKKEVHFSYCHNAIALGYFKAGEIDKAIDHEQQAIDAAKESPNNSADWSKTLQANLDKYKAAKQVH